VAEYQKFNEDLVKAAVVVGAGRLSPSSQGMRVQFDGKKRRVIDGPFAESKELVAGYWLWQVRSMDEALEWLKRAPTTGGPSRSARSRCTRAREGGRTVETAAQQTHRAIEAIWRIESARLIARLARLVGDIGTAEELAQDALVAALEQRPTSGMPEKPGAWLMATAKHRANDLIRRRKTLERKYEELGRDAERDEPSLKSYHLLPAVRGDLLRKLGRFEEAGAEFKRAALLTENARERALLQRRAAECAAERMAG
jgi:DNA-directed RNA polymerase specialized sigma24 family protein